jgi:hypothetical protein
VIVMTERLDYRYLALVVFLIAFAILVVRLVV